MNAGFSAVTASPVTAPAAAIRCALTIIAAISWRVMFASGAKLSVVSVNENDFAPARNVTRAEFTTLIVILLGLTEEAGNAFADVKAQDWYAHDVARAVRAGIVNGKADWLF